MISRQHFFSVCVEETVIIASIRALFTSLVPYFIGGGEISSFLLHCTHHLTCKRSENLFGYDGDLSTLLSAWRKTYFSSVDFGT